MCEYVMMFGGCCEEMLAGPFDWYGHRRTLEIPPGVDYPDEPNEAEFFYRTPSQWPNAFYSSSAATWYTSQDADTPWTIEYLDSGDDELEFRIGRMDMTVAPYAPSGQEWCWSRREAARLLTLGTNLFGALDTWTPGASATFADGRLEADSPTADDPAVEITHSFSAPANGFYRVRVEGTGAFWILVWIDWGGFFPTKLWINLATGEFGASCTGYRTFSPRNDDPAQPGLWTRDGQFNCKVELFGVTTPDVLIRIVDGDGAEDFNGSDGDGVDDLTCELRLETVTDAGIELALLDVDGGGVEWVDFVSTEDIVDVGTETQYDGTALDGLSYAEQVGALYPSRTAAGVANSGEDLIEFHFNRPIPGAGYGNFASDCVSASDGEIWFWTSGRNGDDSGGDVLLMYDNTGAATYWYGAGESEWGYINGILPEITGIGDYDGGVPRFLQPIGNYNNKLEMDPLIVCFAPRANKVAAIVLEKPYLHQDAGESPLPTVYPDTSGSGGSWYLAVTITNYCAFTAGDPQNVTYPFEPDDSGFGESSYANWFNHDPPEIPFIIGSGSALWYDEYSQDRLVSHQATGGWTEDEEAYTLSMRENGQVFPHNGVNFPGTFFDSHGSEHAAIFTHWRAVATIDGEDAWTSWDEGAEDPPVAEPTESLAVSYWLTLCVGSAATVASGIGNVVVEKQIYNDDQIGWLTGLSAVQAQEGTSRKAFVWAEKLFDEEDMPDAEGNGTHTGYRVHYGYGYGATWADIWTFETPNTATTPDCIASSDRWIYLKLDADDDGKSQWIFSHEPADDEDPSAGPLYRHYPSYDNGTIQFDDYPGGAGLMKKDTVKRSGLVPQTPAVQDYS